MRPRPAPLPWGAKAVSNHAPYMAGHCSDCHLGSGANPGPLKMEGDELCFSCHDQLTQHAHAFKKCTVCHNPHDSALRKLLAADLDECVNCHSFSARR